MEVNGIIVVVLIAQSTGYLKFNIYLVGMCVIIQLNLNLLPLQVGIINTSQLLN